MPKRDEREEPKSNDLSLQDTNPIQLTTIQFSYHQPNETPELVCGSKVSGIRGSLHLNCLEIVMMGLS
jgi:hypothetical protein